MDENEVGNSGAIELDEALAAGESIKNAPIESQKLDLSQSPQSRDFLSGVKDAVTNIPSKIAEAYESLVSPRPDEMQQKLMASNLEKSGVITPETINNVDVLVSQGYITQQQAEALRRKYGKPTASMQENELMAQAQVAPILENTGIAPAPVGINTVLKDGVKEAVRDIAAEEKANQEAQLKAQEEVAKAQAAQQEQLLAQKQMEAEQAKKLAAQKQLAEQKRLEEEQKRQAEKEQQIAQQESDEEDGIFNPKSSTGKKIAQAFAVLLGGAAVGLGAKSNAALDVLNKQLDERIKAKKFNEEQALALKKLALDKFDSETRRQMANNDSLLARAKYTEALAQINAERAKIGDMQQAYSQARAGGLPAAALDTLPESDRARAVPLPNGNFGLAVSGKAADKVRADLADMDDASKALKRLSELGEYFGNNPIKKVADRTAVAEADTLQRAIIGKMRLSLFGPGVLTDTEQALAAKIVRNPSDIMTLASANKAAYNTLVQKLKYSQKHQLRSVGVDVPKDKNEIMLEQAKRKYPKAKESELISALIRQGIWQDE